MDRVSIDNWLNDAFAFPGYILSSNDESAIQSNKTGWIVSKLFKKEFRKAKVHPETEADIIKKVELSIENKLPLHLIISFGGYKHFWNPSYPEVDFAELFNLRFMSEYVAPILKVHEPGVVLDYESEDTIITWMDNYPPKDLDRYAESFRELMKDYSQSIPSNFKISLIRSQEQLDENKLKSRVEALLPNMREEWAGLSAEERDYRLHRSPNNIKWDGFEDWTGLTPEEKDKKILESKIVNETYYVADFEFRTDYFTGGNHIPLVLSWGLSKENISHWLTLGSTHGSTVDFWSGRGILEVNNGKVIERVVSHSQYDRFKDKLDIIDAFKESQLKNLRSLEVGENLGIGTSVPTDR